MNDSATFIKVGNSYSVLDGTVTLNLDMLNLSKHLICEKIGNEYCLRAYCFN